MCAARSASIRRRRGRARRGGAARRRQRGRRERLLPLQLVGREAQVEVGRPDADAGAKLDDDDDGDAAAAAARARARARGEARRGSDGVRACTFVNLSGAANCEMCGTALGGGDARAGFEPYTCSVCTFQNLDPKHAAACEMCGTPK